MREAGYCRILATTDDVGVVRLGIVEGKGLLYVSSDLGKLAKTE